MKTFELNKTENPGFDYWYGVHDPFTMSGDRIRVMDWREDDKIDCQIGIHAIYFKTEQDRLLFLLWYKQGR